MTLKSCVLSRRDVVFMLAAAATTAQSGLALADAAKPSARHSARRIDVHHHFRMPGMKVLAADHGWSPSRSIEQMDKFDIATAIVSVPTMMDLYDGSKEARDRARSYNEFAATMASDYPGRFGSFACIPLPDQEGSLKEIEHAYDTLRADGIGLFTNTGTQWPGDPAFDPVFAELNRRKAVVFLHPQVANCCHSLIPDVAEGVLEYDFDTTRAIVSLLASGTLSKYPNIRYIVNHSGADVPVMAGRIQDRLSKESLAKIPNGVLPELQKLYYEVAHATYPWPMAALTRFVPTTQILFGSDYPFEAVETTVEHIPDAGLTPAAWRSINRTNAERLFPRLRD
jgi:6-methylsalicylate decarboxylase